MCGCLTGLFVSTAMGAVVGLAANSLIVANQVPQTGKDLVFGVWNLKVAKSKFIDPCGPHGFRTSLMGILTVSNVFLDSQKAMIAWYQKKMEAIEKPTAGKKHELSLLFKSIQTDHEKSAAKAENSALQEEKRMSEFKKTY